MRAQHLGRAAARLIDDWRQWTFVNEEATAQARDAEKEAARLSGNPTTRALPRRRRGQAATGVAEDGSSEEDEGVESNDSVDGLADDTCVSCSDLDMDGDGDEGPTKVALERPGKRKATMLRRSPSRLVGERGAAVPHRGPPVTASTVYRRTSSHTLSLCSQRRDS